jgi:hypothetical protein
MSSSHVTHHGTAHRAILGVMLDRLLNRMMNVGSEEKLAGCRVGAHLVSPFLKEGYTSFGTDRQGLKVLLNETADLKLDYVNPSTALKSQVNTDGAKSLSTDKSRASVLFWISDSAHLPQGLANTNRFKLDGFEVVPKRTGTTQSNVALVFHLEPPF